MNTMLILTGTKSIGKYAATTSNMSSVKAPSGNCCTTCRTNRNNNNKFLGSFSPSIADMKPRTKSTPISCISVELSKILADTVLYNIKIMHF